MSLIILPERAIKRPDPFISPVYGNRGPCLLCGHYSDLTENHVPPQSVGNFRPLIAKSYMTASTSDRDMFFGRRFPNGLRFKTICADCNSKLGGDEDKEIARFYDSVSKFITSGLRVPPVVKITVCPNKIIKGLFAHVVSASEKRLSSSFDREARELFFGKRTLRETRFNLFYWVYTGSAQLLMRDVLIAEYSPRLNMAFVQLIKIFPLGIVITDKHRFFGLPNLRMFITSRDEEERDIPIVFAAYENHPTWPAVPDNRRIVFFGEAGSGGIIATPQ